MYYLYNHIAWIYNLKKVTYIHISQYILKFLTLPTYINKNLELNKKVKTKLINYNSMNYLSSYMLILIFLSIF